MYFKEGYRKNNLIYAQACIGEIFNFRGILKENKKYFQIKY